VLLGRLRTAAEGVRSTAHCGRDTCVDRLALDGRAQRSAAVESLEHAWADAAEPDEHVRLFLDEGTPMIDLLGEAARSSVDSAKAQRLLDFFFNAARGIADA
jgi:LuxR family maltose regulon positive regulatory protein